MSTGPLPSTTFEVLERPPGSDALAFSEGDIERSVLVSVMRSVFAIRASCPDEGTSAIGTGVLVGLDEATRLGIIATAAHVVEHRDRQPWPEIAVRAEGTSEFMPAYLLAATGYEGGEQDVALMGVNGLPQSVEVRPMFHRPQQDHSLLIPGARVAYVGYPLGLSESGAHDVMFGRGMVAGLRRRQHPDGGEFLAYILDGMVSAGMSGGPLFCPATGGIAGLLTGVVTPAHVTGHGWSYAVPSDEIARLWVWAAGEVGMEVKGYQPREQ